MRALADYPASMSLCFNVFAHDCRIDSFPVEAGLARDSSVSGAEFADWYAAIVGKAGKGFSDVYKSRAKKLPEPLGVSDVQRSG